MKKNKVYVKQALADTASSVMSDKDESVLAEKGVKMIQARSIVAANVEGKDIIIAFVESSNECFGLVCPAGFLKGLSESYKFIELSGDEFLKAMEMEIAE